MWKDKEAQEWAIINWPLLGLEGRSSAQQERWAELHGGDDDVGSMADDEKPEED